MEVQGSPRLKLKAVEIRDDITVLWILCMAKDVLAPAVAVCTSEIAPGDLLRGYGPHGESPRQIGRFQAVTTPDVLNEARPKKSPLIWADGERKWWKPVLVYCIHEAKVLPLPVSNRKIFFLKTGVWATPRCLRRIYGAGDGLEELLIILVLEDLGSPGWSPLWVKAPYEWSWFSHWLSSCALGLSFRTRLWNDADWATMRTRCPHTLDHWRSNK